jgi:hypothetical protein
LRILPDRHVSRQSSLTHHLFALPFQVLGLLAQIAVERGDVEVALGFAHRATHNARELRPTDPAEIHELTTALEIEADILDSLGRPGGAMALDDERGALTPGETHPAAGVRLATQCLAAGGMDAEAEELLRRCMYDVSTKLWDRRLTRKTMIEDALKPHNLLAELLERRGTEEALAEARTLRDEVAHELARYEAKTAAAVEETRAAATEAARQWREERINAVEEKKGGKGKKKGKGKK